MECELYLRAARFGPIIRYVFLTDSRLHEVYFLDAVESASAKESKIIYSPYYLERCANS